MRCVGLILSAILGFTASAVAQQPVAFVYLTSYPRGSFTPSRIYGFSAAASGQLTPISGTPVASRADSLASTGKWLFGSDASYDAIFSYRIAADGALKFADKLTPFPVASGDIPADVMLDHTGSTLYAGHGIPNDQNGYASYSINHTSGKLTFLDDVPTGLGQFYPVTFTGNNQFAYASACYHQAPVIDGFMRTTNGGLRDLGLNAPIPHASANEEYCPTTAVAADPYNDVVVALAEEGVVYGPTERYQLAVYTADVAGNLATTSTAANMVVTAVEPDYLAMSPKGYYLAATGATGLQIFLMHGSKPPTALTGAILPKIPMGRAYWDNNEHLYVAGDRLYVFTVGTAGVKEAPGSRYAVPGPGTLIVLPK